MNSAKCRGEQRFIHLLVALINIEKEYFGITYIDWYIYSVVGRNNIHVLEMTMGPIFFNHGDKTLKGHFCLLR